MTPLFFLMNCKAFAKINLQIFLHTLSQFFHLFTQICFPFSFLLPLTFILRIHSSFFCILCFFFMKAFFISFFITNTILFCQLNKNFLNISWIPFNFFLKVKTYEFKLNDITIFSPFYSKMLSFFLSSSFNFHIKNS